MPTTIHADASPEKRLFISLLTRDISLEAAFLDLIDNSVNAALVSFSNRLDTARDYLTLLDDPEVKPVADIRINFSPDRIGVTDTAPGISLQTARHHVFRFGRPDHTGRDTDRLSVYGLGLKRAIFKAGRRIQITSDHAAGGFDLDLDVIEWAKKETGPWQFDLVPRDPVERSQCGTTIEITDLLDQTSTRLDDGFFEASLRERVARTYSYFLNKFVSICVNDRPIDAINLRIGKNTATDSFSEGPVTCAITAGLGSPDGDKYRDKGSGWFIFCNGRNVISADKSPLTGWQNELPIFQPKHRPFLGTVYFVSKYPDRLPWDTTKSRINEDSSIWQSAKPRMAAVGRSVTSFLDSRYSDPGTDSDHKDLRQVAGERMDVIRASSTESRNFVKPKISKNPNVQIQYSAKLDHVKRIAKYLSRPAMSGSAIGRHTFDFFLRNEVGGD